MQKEDNNQNLKIDWGNWESNESTNEPTNESTSDWETITDKPSEETTTDFSIDPEKEDRDPTPEEMDLWKLNVASDYSYLGVIKTIEINPELYMLNFDNAKAVSEIDFNKLEKIDDDGKYKIKSPPKTELTNILATISNIATNKNLRLSNFFLLHNLPRQSTINIFRGKNRLSFIYILKADKNSGNIVLDLSSLGGPAQKIFDTHEGMLVVFEGWIPYRLTRNVSETDLIAIAGNID